MGAALEDTLEADLDTVLLVEVGFVAVPLTTGVTAVLEVGVGLTA